jgi:exosortase A
VTAVLPIRKAEPLALPRWRTHLLALGLAATAILILFARDVASLVGVWLDTATFNHCALILPLIAWLVWQRLPELRPMTPAAWMPGLAIVALGALAWLAGYAGSVALARHAGLVVMLQGAVIACLGKSVSLAIAFPIFYAFFLVPVGDQLVPPLQTATAQMGTALLGLAGVPAHLEGIFITTPTGYFEVAEACSGIQFLVAMTALGALAANVCFRSWRRRILFMAAVVVLPILANGVRAFAVIYIDEVTGIEFAASDDHILFGWIFFGVAMALVMAVGRRFFDRKPGDPWLDASALQPVATVSSPIAFVAAAAVAIAALPLAWSAAATSAAQPVPSGYTLPNVPGWQKVEARSRLPWRPHYANADLFRIARYRNSAGEEIDLAVAVYARQEDGRELVGFGQGAIGPDGRWAWTGSGEGPQGSRLDRIASHGTTREVATFYRVGGIVTGSELAVKLETMKTRLLGGPTRAAAVVVSAESPAEAVSPRPAIERFLVALGPPQALADQAAGAP